jgi:hypothetical protein
MRVSVKDWEGSDHGLFYGTISRIFLEVLRKSMKHIMIAVPQPGSEILCSCVIYSAIHFIPLCVSES